jgi:hypothetical protein
MAYNTDSVKAAPPILSMAFAADPHATVLATCSPYWLQRHLMTFGNWGLTLFYIGSLTNPSIYKTVYECNS